MNKTLLIGVVALVLVGAGIMVMNSQKPVQAPTQTETSQTTTENTTDAMSKNTVEIKDFAFGPATLTVKVGESVTFTNKDAVGHTATADDESFDTEILEQGESKTVTFSEAGTFSYHCIPHPNMKGTIVVE